MTNEADLYAVLGVSRSAKETEIRRAYRNLVTKEHPDKGGDAARFTAVQRAYDVLSVESKRKRYDATGVAERSPDEELLDAFAGGKFRDKQRAADDERATLNESLAVRHSKDATTHTAGFDAWLRARGDGVKVYTGDDIAEEFGVNPSSYEHIKLPNIRAYQARCNALGNPSEVMEMVQEAIPGFLEWGECLVHIRATPISPGDLYNVRMGATPFSLEADAPKPPFVAGNDGLAVVMKVGPGCKQLNEGDWVVPHKPGLGTWRSLAVWRERDVLKLPPDLMPVEYAAMMREMCVAYRLLEDNGSLKPGDGVILNAATSTVGCCVIQLCRMLKLRAVAVVRDPPPPPAPADATAADAAAEAAAAAEAFERTAARLRALGAAEVVRDGRPLAPQLAAAKFFAKPRLGLDAVGGASAAGLADALADGCQLVVYGCMSGRAPHFPWSAWVFKDLQIPLMLETLAKLVNADKLRLDFTEYELCDELKEALDHAQEAGRNTKVLLRVNDIGVKFD